MWAPPRVSAKSGPSPLLKNAYNQRTLQYQPVLYKYIEAAFMSNIESLSAPQMAASP